MCIFQKNIINKTKMNFFDADYLSRIVIVVIAVMVASLVTRKGMSTPGAPYTRIIKSPYQPARMWFGIVWSLLYLGFVLSWILCTREFNSKYNGDTKALKESDDIHIFALFLNVLWCVLFFGFGLITFSGVLLVIIVAFAIYTAFRLRYLVNEYGRGTVSSDQTALFVVINWLAYTAWCAFATFLNFTTTY